MFSIMRALFFAEIALAFLQLGSRSAAQDCPRWDPAGPEVESASRTLVGAVAFHDDLRQWLSLQLDTPVCGERVVQLIQRNEPEKPQSIEVFRGCRVTVTGRLRLPGTGYFSAELYQDVDKIEPLVGCIRRPAFPDYDKMKPARGVYTYRVSIWFNYGFEDPVHARALTGTRVLSPWQAYAHYFLTGGFGFYGYCADGFTMSHMSGTPEAKPWMIDNYVAMDPETAAADKGVHAIKLSFTCSCRRPKTARTKN